MFAGEFCCDLCALGLLVSLWVLICGLVCLTWSSGFYSLVLSTLTLRFDFCGILPVLGLCMVWCYGCGFIVIWVLVLVLGCLDFVILWLSITTCLV